MNLGGIIEKVCYVFSQKKQDERSPLSLEKVARARTEPVNFAFTSRHSADAPLRSTPAHAARVGI